MFRRRRGLRHWRQLVPLEDANCYCLLSFRTFGVDLDTADRRCRKYAVPDDNESNWLPWGYRKQAGDVYHVNSQTAEAIFFCVTSVSYLKPCNKIRISATTRKGQTCADRKSTRLNSSHLVISYAVFC